MSIQGVLLLIIVVGVVLGAVNDPSLKGGACH